MKLTKKNVSSIKNDTQNKLSKYVCEYVLKRWNDYDNKQSIFTDVLNYGCQSGIVGELVYYSDTTEFYQKYKEEINELLYNALNNCGIYNPVDLFGDRWDKEDPLCIDCINQNLLAWFGFEDALRNLAYNFEELEEII